MLNCLLCPRTEHGQIIGGDSLYHLGDKFIINVIYFVEQNGRVVSSARCTFGSDAYTSPSDIYIFTTIRLQCHHNMKTLNFNRRFEEDGWVGKSRDH
jgi:hypothetical protein